MSTDDLSLLQQAQAHARKPATLSLGATTPDGQSGEAHVAVQKTWRTWSVVAYAQTLFKRGQKTQTAAGVEVTKTL